MKSAFIFLISLFIFLVVLSTGCSFVWADGEFAASVGFPSKLQTKDVEFDNRIGWPPVEVNR